jgi:hypothetical protein
MKRLMPAFIVMSTTLAAVRLAAGDVKAGYYCHSPVADGGYVVRIEPGGAAETARVILSADSLIGPHLIESYDVNVATSGPDTLFEGRGFTLTMREHPRKSGGRQLYDANFTAITGRGVIKDRVGCSSPSP